MKTVLSRVLLCRTWVVDGCRGGRAEGVVKQFILRCLGSVCYSYRGVVQTTRCTASCECEVLKNQAVKPEVLELKFLAP